MDVPAAHADVRGEIEAFHGSAALVPLREVTFLVQEGADGLDLLHRLTTNDLLSLVPGTSRHTAVTTERGRIVDVLLVAVLARDRLLLLSESPDASRTVEWIEKFTIIEDSLVRDVSQEVARFALVGPSAAQIANDAFGAGMSGESGSVHSDPDESTYLVSSRWGGHVRVDVVVPAERGDVTRQLLIDAGANLAGEAAYDAVRIAAGVPAVGRELSEDVNPLEAGLKSLISFTKGCYIGQEVVARLDAYDKLQKRLVRFESDVELSAGMQLIHDGKRAGEITSASSVVSGTLGFARRDFWSDGTELEFDGGTLIVRDLGDAAPFA